MIPDPTELFALSGDKIRLYYHGTFQQASGDKSFSSPHEYDYFVNASGDGFQLNGYTDPDPYLTYDLVNTGSICIDFSGLWGNVCSDTTTYYPTQTGCEYANKTWFTGEYVTDQLHDADKHSRIWLGNNLKWYPKFAQFIETGNDTVTITGVSGENGFVSVHDKDIYLNGQKLIYGKGYQTGMHSAYVCSDPQWLTKPDCEDDGDTWSVESVLPSLVLLPDLPGWAYEGTMATFNNGTVYMPDNVFAPELCFVPKTTGDTPNILVRDVSVAPDATVGGITDPLSGFSELVWLNGLRQQKRLDYQKGLECSLSKTFTIFEENPMVFYNNSADSINIE